MSQVGTRNAKGLCYRFAKILKNRISMFHWNLGVSFVDVQNATGFIFSARNHKFNLHLCCCY